MVTSNAMRLFKREGRRQRKVGNGPTSCELERLTELTRRVTSVSQVMPRHRRLMAFSINSAPKALTHLFFLSMGNLVISMLKLRAFANFSILKSHVHGT
jgi:hypothetical protein